MLPVMFPPPVVFPPPVMFLPPAAPGFVPANGALETALTIAFVVIGFIGWVVQQINQAKAQKAQRPGPAGRPPVAGRPPGGRPGGQRPPGPQPRDERLQSEIDAFLREVSGRKKPPQVLDEAAIEVIEDEPRRAAPAATAGAAGLTGQRSDRDREQLRRERTVSTLGDRHLEATPLGADLRKHVEGYMNESLQLRKEKEQVERRLAEARAELHAMRSQAGGLTAGGPAVGAAPGGSARPDGSKTPRFASLLTNKASVKDAIVINEVLGRPKGLRRGGG